LNKSHGYVTCHCQLINCQLVNRNHVNASTIANGKPSRGFFSFFFSFMLYMYLFYFFSFDNINHVVHLNDDNDNHDDQTPPSNTTITSTNPQAAQRVETAMAAAAGLETRHVSGRWYVFFFLWSSLLLIFIMLMYILD
jgi:hypothetical protein